MHGIHSLLFLKKPLLLWVLSGLLTGAALLFPSIWFLVFVGLGVQLHLLYRADTARSVLFGASVAGVVHMLVVQLWGWEVVSFALLGVSPLAQLVIIFFGWSSSSLFIGIGYGVCLWLVRYIADGHWITFVLFPLGVLGGELVGRLLFSIGSVSFDTGLNVSYGFGHVGYALAEHGILRFAAIFGGVYALTFVLGVLTTLLYVSLVQCRTYWVGVVLSVVIFVSSFVGLDFRSDFPLPNDVALVSTYLTMEFETTRVDPQTISEMYENAISEALKGDPSAVILPEDSRFFNTLDEDKREAYVTQFASSSTMFVESSRGVRDNKTVLSAVVFDDTTAEMYTYDKQYLVPFGEQIPVFPALFLRFIGFGGAVETLQSEFGYRTGVQKSEVETPEGLPDVLFCYESVVPYAVREMYTETTPYIAHVVSHAWFDDRWGILEHQLGAMLRIQAVWNNIPILQASNITPSAVYTPAGEKYTAPKVPEGQYWRVDLVSDIISGYVR